jgi:hypothetical protein
LVILTASNGYMKVYRLPLLIFHRGRIILTKACNNLQTVA